MNTKHCKFCNNQMLGMATQAKYCSRICYSKMLTEKYRSEVRASMSPRNCTNCKKLYQPTGKRTQNFCSALCRYDFRDNSRKTTTIKECEHCGKKFMQSRSFQVFCDWRCRNAVTYLKRVTGMSAGEYRAMPMISANSSLETTTPEIIDEKNSLPICVNCGVNTAVSLENVHCNSCMESQ